MQEKNKNFIRTENTLINRYFRLRFGLVDTINFNLRLEIRAALRAIFSLKCFLIEFTKVILKLKNQYQIMILKLSDLQLLHNYMRTLNFIIQIVIFIKFWIAFVRLQTLKIVPPKNDQRISILWAMFIRFVTTLGDHE